MADRQRLLRWQRLVRIRSIAREDAARQAAAAEGTLAQLQALVERTGRLTGAYDAIPANQDAAQLGASLRFRSGLLAIKAQAMADHHQAQTAADALQLALALAERRCTLVKDRADALAQTMTRTENIDLSAAARRIGTELDQ